MTEAAAKITAHRFRLVHGTFRDGSAKHRAGDEVHSERDLVKRYPGQFTWLSEPPPEPRQFDAGRSGLDVEHCQGGWRIINTVTGRPLSDVPLMEGAARSFMDDDSGTRKKLFHCPPIWNGTCVIVGGGASLMGTNFAARVRASGFRAIACNDGYTLDETCDVCHFGDERWFLHHYPKGLGAWPGLKTTSATHALPLPDVKVFRRLPAGLVGLQSRWELGWNASTGAEAINLALMLGARRIILVGFDMVLTNGTSNWYINELVQEPDPQAQLRHLLGIRRLALAIQDVKRHPLWADVEVLNVKTHHDSPLDCFPLVKLDDILPMRKAAKAAAKTPDPIPTTPLPPEVAKTAVPEPVVAKEKPKASRRTR